MDEFDVASVTHIINDPFGPKREVATDWPNGSTETLLRRARLAVAPSKGQIGTSTAIARASLRSFTTATALADGAASLPVPGGNERADSPIGKCDRRRN